MPEAQFEPDFLKKGINVYEVIRVIDYVPLFVEDHCDRFSKSLKGKKMDFLCHPQKLKDKLALLIEKNDLKYGNIKLVYHFHDKEECYLIIYPVVHTYPRESDFRNGVKATLLYEERPDPELKNWRPGFKKRVKELKEKKHVFEIILVNNEGIVTEGSQSNLFFIEGARIITARKERVLGGITRKYVYEIARNNDIQIIEKDFTIDELPQFQSAFLSGTSPKILPLRSIDSYNFDPSNPLLNLIMRNYDEVIRGYIKS